MSAIRLGPSQSRSDPFCNDVSLQLGHYLPLGEPPWLFHVAPPGTGKTTTGILGACELPDIITMGDVTENTFLSGFYGAREPGLLEKIGMTRTVDGVHTTQGDAILLIKDFTTVLAMRREKKAAILSQLREMYDGEFKRAFGTGETKIWRGRITVIAAVTSVLDRHYSIFSTLGERFLQVRSHRPDSPVAGEWAIRQQGHELEIRQELREAVNSLFQGASGDPPKLPSEATTRLAKCAEIIAIARTHVYRDGYGGREIEYVPEPEANTRIAKGLTEHIRPGVVHACRPASLPARLHLRQETQNNYSGEIGSVSPATSAEWPATTSCRPDRSPRQAAATGEPTQSP